MRSETESARTRLELLINCTEEGKIDDGSHLCRVPLLDLRPVICDDFSLARGGSDLTSLGSILLASALPKFLLLFETVGGC
jgi:hypothetical protein